MRIFRTLPALICASYLALSADSGSLNAASVTTAPKFPLIFYPSGSEAQAGLLLGGGKRRFETGCYHFGEGGAVNISISADLLAYYMQQGFSRRSLCMALISAIRFDPETGRRLATYVVINDLKELRRHPDDMGVTSPELPLTIPSCFARALPYSDCTWNFDAFTGKKLSAPLTQRFKALGRIVEDAIRAFKNGPHEAARDVCEEGSPDWRPTTSEKAQKLCSYYQWQTLDPDLSITNDAHLGEEYTKEYNIDPYYFDLSQEFPEGFGYGLIYYDTGLGSSVPDDVIKAALEGAKRPAQVDPAKLKELWGYGGQ
jgi:hypothetical protein